MSLPRLALRIRAQARPFLLGVVYKSPNSAFPRILAPKRSYASAKKQAKSTSTLVPRSKQRLTDPAAQSEYEELETSMKSAVEWFRKECATLEARASGRVTPTLLSPVRVKLPGRDTEVRLEEVATVGVRDGSMLIVTVFEENNLKLIEQALYDSKISGVVPQKQDARTIRIPMPKPTVETRLGLYTGAARKAEEIRTQVRKLHQASVKRGQYAKHSIELEEFQKLVHRYNDDVDKILASLKNATGAK